MLTTIIKTAINYFKEKSDLFFVVAIKDIKTWYEGEVLRYSFTLSLTYADYSITVDNAIFGGIIGTEYWIDTYDDYDGDIVSIF